MSSTSVNSCTGPMLVGAGRRNGPSILVSPKALLKNNIALSAQEVEKRLGNLSLYKSVEELDNAELPPPKSLLENLQETYEMTKYSTSEEEFEAFLSRRLSSDEFFRRMTESEFFSRFEEGRFLGEGATSSVRLYRRREDNTIHAVKAVNASLIWKHRFLLREVAILQSVRHRNIIELHEAILTEKHLYLVMEYAEGEPLFDHIIRVRTYEEKDAKKMVKKILEAVSYLHSQGVAHRDLKPENIIVCCDDDDDIKIVDFGFAGMDVDDVDGDCKKAEGGGGGMNTPVGGTPGYKAPQMLFAHAYGRAVDIWSVGVISYILLCGFPPYFSNPHLRDTMDFLSHAPFWYFINKDTKELRDAILDGSVSFPSPFWDGVSREAQSFVKALLTVDDRTRLTADQALLHPWFSTTTSVETSMMIPTPQSPLTKSSSERHLLRESLAMARGQSSENLPIIIGERMTVLREKLERLLAVRPSMEHLRASGIIRSAGALNNTEVGV